MIKKRIIGRHITNVRKMRPGEYEYAFGDAPWRGDVTVVELDDETILYAVNQERNLPGEIVGRDALRHPFIVRPG